MRDLPSNDRDAKEGADAAEHKSNDASSRKAGWQRSDTPVLVFQVKDIDRVASSIAFERRLSCTTDIIVILRHCQALLKLEWRFDQSGSEAAHQMPVYVAMEEPDT